jgi:hypothetical protein
MSGLSVNPISYYSSYFPQKNATSALTAFHNLGTALQSGNLSGAQVAFATLQDTRQGQNQGGTNNAIVADMANLSNALSSNNLSSAQAAYAQLHKDVEAQRGHHNQQASGTGGVFQSLISQLLPSSLSSTGSSTSISGSPTSSLIPGTLNVQA